MMFRMQPISISVDADDFFLHSAFHYHDDDKKFSFESRRIFPLDQILTNLSFYRITRLTYRFYFGEIKQTTFSKNIHVFAVKLFDGDSRRLVRTCAMNTNQFSRKDAFLCRLLPYLSQLNATGVCFQNQHQDSSAINHSTFFSLSLFILFLQKLLNLRNDTHHV